MSSLGTFLQRPLETLPSYYELVGPPTLWFWVLGFDTCHNWQEGEEASRSSRRSKVVFSRLQHLSQSVHCELSLFSKRVLCIQALKETNKKVYQRIEMLASVA